VGYSLDDLNIWLREPESERLEFKEAKSKYDFDKLVKYCAALANEGGGKMVLGVTDRRPRQVVGSLAYPEPGQTVAQLAHKLHLRIDWAEIQHAAGRVLVFVVPSHPIGVPIQADGAYYARSGDSLGPLRPEELRKIFDEAGPDYSAEFHRSAGLSDLNPDAVERFRRMWRRQSNNANLDTLSAERLLSDAELLCDGKVTHAALVLLGSKAALSRYLGQAEVIFEYRASEASIAYQQRIEYREGFLGFLDEVWERINLRNERLHYQDGLYLRDIPVFNELVVREAILNAVTHRDYRLPGSVFVKQYPRKLEIISPGGFPVGVSAENIVRKQSPRNRRIAEACARCGLVERSGQGADRMFEKTIREGKPKPDFDGTDEYEVRLTLNGEIQNPQFLRFLEKAALEEQVSFTLDDLLVLDSLQRETPVPRELKTALSGLWERGIVERIGKGRGVRFFLSRRFYSFLGKPGSYTRKRGLDRETQKALLLGYIREASVQGAKLRDMQDVLKDLSRAQIQTLLRELKEEGKIEVRGLTRAGLWYPA
jgi:ATP-dependent DNA helicase RecG